MDDLSRFCCLNSDCPEHGKRGAGNLTVTSRYGPDKAATHAPLPHLQGPLLRAEGDAPVRLPAAAGEGRIGPGAHRRGVRRPPDRPALQGEPRHRRPPEPAGRRARPRPPRRAGRRFPPRTREVQFDEKWAFVAKKEANCDPDDPADDRKGDTWDHVAIDAESRLVVSVVPGERTAENVVAVVEDFKRRTGGRLMDLITTDGYPAYEEAILDAYGETITPPRTGKRGRPRAPYKVAPAGPDLCRGGEDPREGAGGVESPRGWSSARWRR